MRTRENGYRVVLVGSLYGGNVGAIARLAANFEVSELFAVNPVCDPFGDDARRLATGVSCEDLARIQVVPSLQQALHGCGVRVGFTSRDTVLNRPVLSIAKTVDWPVGVGSMALVFGREDTGLWQEELLQCTHVCSIPTSLRKSSMNLSHAVAVVLSHLPLFLNSADGDDGVCVPRVRHFGAAPANALEFQHLMERWEHLLGKLGLHERGGPQAFSMKIRTMLLRAQVSHHEVSMLQAFLSKVQRTIETGSSIGETSSVESERDQ